MQFAVMIRNINLFITLNILSFSIMSQNVIEGNIMQMDGNPQPGANVYIEGSGHGGSTNGSGYFELKDIPDGSYVLSISCLGYNTFNQNVEVRGNTTIKLNLTLEESISQLNEVVISGGHTGIKDIPGSVQYISPKEMDQFSYTDVNRTLRSVPGVNIQEEDGFGLRPNIGLRGSGSERSSKINLMEDGILIAPAPYVAPAAYYFPTLGRMQGMEIMKGSSQIKYGPYTTGGSLNLISTQIPDHFGGRMDFLFGSFGTNTLHANFGNSNKNLGYMVEAFQYGSDGFKQIDGGGNTGFDKKDYLGKIRINSDERAKIDQSLTLKLGYAEESSNETYLGLSQEDFDENSNRRYSASQMDELNTEHYQISIGHVAKFANKMKLVTTVYRNDFRRNWYKLDKVLDSSGISNSIAAILDNPDENEDAYDILKGRSSFNEDALHVKANNRQYYAEGIQMILNKTFTTGELKHEVEIGFRAHEDQMDRYQWVDKYRMDNGTMKLTTAGQPGTESNRIETAQALASYVQYKLRMNKITITPGLRYEYISMTREDYGNDDIERTGKDLLKRRNDVDIFIPGIGLDYLFNNNLSTFLGVHKGFAPPGTKEGSLPEESINYELGLRYRKSSLSWTAIAFFNDYSNLLGADMNANGGSGTNELHNGGEVDSKGLELQATYDLLASQKKSKFSIPITFSYTYSQAKFVNGFKSDFEGWNTVHSGDELPYVAHHQAALVIGLNYQAVQLSLSGKYLSEMRTEPGQGEIPENERIPSSLILDASLSILVHKNVSFVANAVNLTDSKYLVSRRPAGLRPGLPRSLNIGVKARF